MGTHKYSCTCLRSVYPTGNDQDVHAYLFVQAEGIINCAQMQKKTIYATGKLPLRFTKGNSILPYVHILSLSSSLVRDEHTSNRFCHIVHES